jgi:multiple sugar transport system permease protein
VAPTVAARPAAPAQARRRGRRSTAQSRRNARIGLLLAAPALVFVAVFALYPLGFGAYISLTNWPLVGAYHFIGLSNYSALAHNSEFLDSIVFTLKYTAIVTIPIFVVGYGLAMFVRGGRKGSVVFRTLIFLPYIVGLVTELGLVSDTTAWLVHTGPALTAICFLVIWFYAGFAMMMMLAGMQSIPTELYEAARVDGASRWTTEWRITLPNLRRWIALSLIISVVGSLLAFNQFFIMTDGGPGTSTVTVVMSIFSTAFAQMNVGLASAMSVVLVIVVGLITFAQFRFLREDGDR